MSGYHLDPNRKMYRAVIVIRGVGPGMPNQIQYKGPYMKPGPAKGQVTMHRNHIWKESFIDGWIEVADNWTRVDD